MARTFHSSLKRDFHSLLQWQLPNDTRRDNDICRYVSLHFVNERQRVICDMTFFLVIDPQKMQHNVRQNQVVCRFPITNEEKKEKHINY